MTKVKDLFDYTILEVIHLKLGLDVYEYIIDDKNKNYNNFEAELDSKYLVKGTMVEFSPDIFKKWSSQNDNHTIVNNQKSLEGMSITNSLVDYPFPQEAMTFIYFFTIVEDFGNSITEIVNKSLYLKNMENGKSWHSNINRYAKEKGQDLVLNFATTFNLDLLDVDKKFVDLFYTLKQKRNSIAHELHYPDIGDFKTDIQSLIILICYLYHINDPHKEKNKIYPWYDYETE